LRKNAATIEHPDKSPKVWRLGMWLDRGFCIWRDGCWPKIHNFALHRKGTDSERDAGAISAWRSGSGRCVSSSSLYNAIPSRRDHTFAEKVLSAMLTSSAGGQWNGLPGK